MINNLPNLSNNTKRILIYFVICLFFGICYFVFVKIPQQQAILEENKRKEEFSKKQAENTQSAFFVPPKNLYQEIEVKGKIELIEETDKFQGLDKKATHKITDDKSNILYFAYSMDDKLYQQEGFEITVGAKASYGIKPYTKSLIEIIYIAIK